VQQDRDQLAFGEDGVVRLAEALQVGLPRGGVAELLLDALGAVLDGGDEQRLLGAEQADHVRLGDTGEAGHLIGGGAGVAAGRERCDGCRDQLVVALFGGEAGPGHVDMLSANNYRRRN
jgi:hypothetical protein